MAMTLDEIATRYVTLVRDLGAHSDGYIDAQYGPAKDIPASAQTPPLSAIVEEATALQRAASAVTPPTDDAVSSLRRTFLIKQLIAVAAYARFFSGGPEGSLSFDAEAGQLYDAAPPTQSTAHFQAILDEIDALLPGSGTLLERYTAFKRQFIIPPEKLDAVFVAAIEETRRRTKQHINVRSPHHRVGSPAHQW